YQHSRKNRDFYQYYRSRATYNDEQYFLRNIDKTVINNYYFELNYDVQLCTSHDYKTAVIMSNDLFSALLEDKLEKINNSCSIEHPFLQSSLNWTGNKIDLIEVIYALHHQKVINGGNIEIKELATNLGKVFNIDLEENIYRSYVDIKSRKTVKTKFLNHLSESLNAKIIEEEY
ncbi:RteC domain-containing protein, partial [Flavobacterium psychrophilum]|nr:RteC domain-containing protein [Flavobacterium psychrophilum]